MKKHTLKFMEAIERRTGAKFVRAEYAGSGHIRAWVAGYGKPFILPATPTNEWRTMLNAASFIRRTMQQSNNTKPI